MTSTMVDAAVAGWTRCGGTSRRTMESEPPHPTHTFLAGYIKNKLLSFVFKRRLTTYLQTANRGICRKPSAGVSIAKFYGKLPSRNPVGMLDYLVKYGPLAVTVSATGNFPNYR